MKKTEAERLRALQGYQILDTPPEGAFDRVTALAARIFHVPIALVSLVDEDRIWFMSRQGLDMPEVKRAEGLCASAILSDDAYIVTDALHDIRTLDNPLVAGEFGLRFYAAAPLVTRDGYRLGTFNVMDFAPRDFSADQVEMLESCAHIVMDHMELRLAARHATTTLLKAFHNSKDPQDLLMVCAWTKKVRMNGQWMSFDDFLTETLGLNITHGMHPSASESFLSELDESRSKIRDRKNDDQ